MSVLLNGDFLFYKQEINYLALHSIENLFNTIFLTQYTSNTYKIVELLPELLFFVVLMWALVRLLYSNVVLEYTFWSRFIWYYFLLHLLKITFLGICSNGIFFLFHYSQSYTMFNSQCKLIIIFFCLLFFYLSYSSICISNTLVIKEYPWLLCLAIFFINNLLTSFDFFTAYIIIEGLSLTLFLLANIIHNNFLSKEAAFKYLAMSSVSSGIFLMGLSWFYFLVGNLNFNAVHFFLTKSVAINPMSIPVQSAVVYFFFAIFFKLGAFPCYYWVSDVYSGAWLPITFFFATIIKLTFSLFFIKVLYNPLFPISQFWSSLTLLAGIGSLAIGAIGALCQSNIKKFIAYASINQTGVLLLGLSTQTIFGLKACLMHTVFYILANTILFGILLNCVNLITGRNAVYFADLSGFSYYNPGLAMTTSITLFSMAGIPPLAGFFTKFYIFCSLLSSKLGLENHFRYVIVFSLFFSLISSYYYINAIKQIFFENSKYNKFFWSPGSQNYLLILIQLPIILWCLFFDKCSFLFEMLAIGCSAPLTQHIF